MRRTKLKVGECLLRKERALEKIKGPLEITQIN